MPKTKMLQAKIIEFPRKSAVPVKQPERLIKGNIIGSLLEELGIKDGDDVIIDTFEAVGKGQLILITEGERYACGIAKFIGNGQVELDYIHSTEIFELSEIKIIGRVISSQRSWK